MKILIFSGSHPRHLFVHQELLQFGGECAAVIMQREALMPNAPAGIPEIDRHNFERHFFERNLIEAKSYGELHPDEVFSSIPIHRCLPETLNSEGTTNFVQKFDADFAFIFGVDLIKEPLLSALPKIRINLHLGLSPWYRGSATLFWPFYFLQPQFAGATFHQILPEADAGEILHQTVPALSSGDGIHDVGAKTVIEARKDFGKLLKGYAKCGWIFEKQKSSGRLFLMRDFQAAHLRTIYNTYDNDIVDCYLTGQLEGRKPSLVISKLIA